VHLYPPMAPVNGELAELQGRHGELGIVWYEVLLQTGSAPRTALSGLKVVTVHGSPIALSRCRSRSVA